MIKLKAIKKDKIIFKKRVRFLVKLFTNNIIKIQKMKIRISNKNKGQCQ